MPISRHPYIYIFLFPLQINQDGFFSFGSSYTSSVPHTFSLTSPHHYIVAPFWGDIYTYYTGSIRYQIFTTGAAQLDTVSLFIRRQINSSFSGTWMLVAYWSSVPEYGHSSSIVRELAHIWIISIHFMS